MNATPLERLRKAGVIALTGGGELFCAKSMENFILADPGTDLLSG